ncbi:hypothetical protein [Nocardioides gilvus]|uniref:hypothetical protein n=1 Tax=Nocardioides gilvus TaxID=1735589 RepID=UPI000D74DCF5|nr:hypothetical protein [Nocardioides gilvus]
MNATRRSRARHFSGRSARLRRWGLVTVLVTSLTLSACGDGDDDPKSQGTPSVDSSEPRVIGTFSGTGLRPIEDGHKVTVDGAQGASDWLETLGATEETRAEVSEAIEDADLSDDEILWGAVLSTGCLAPKSWTFTEVDDEWTLDVVPDDEEATTTCVAPVTRIGFVAVPNDD